MSGWASLSGANERDDSMRSLRIYMNTEILVFLAFNIRMSRMSVEFDEWRNK
jgi:hypothetical protein